MPTEADIDLDDRGSLLDAFANLPAATSPGVPAAAALGAGAGVRVVGAQKLAVMREESKVLAKLKMLAAAAGDDWYYRWPVKNRRTGKTDYVEGPSIKLANELARVFGNCENETRVMDLGDSWLIYARFTDYETGYSLTRPFQQRKGQKVFGDKAMSEDAARALDSSFQIGVSKAIRNVVVNALQTFADFALDEAKSALVDKIGKDLLRWRDRTIERVSAKVDVKRVEAVIGRPAGEWLAPDVARVIAMTKAVQEGMADMDETFPPLTPPAEEPKPGGKLDEFATGQARER
jgi:hypothetical protein